MLEPGIISILRLLALIILSCDFAGGPRELFGRIWDYHVFLFGALALLQPNKAPSSVADWLAVVIPVVGLFTAVSTFVAIRLANNELDQLRALWEKQPAELRATFPAPVGRKGRAAIFGPSLGLPILLGLAWLWPLGSLLWRWVAALG